MRQLAGRLWRGWPPYSSPDLLNPIENFWGILTKKLKRSVKDCLTASNLAHQENVWKEVQRVAARLTKTSARRWFEAGSVVCVNVCRRRASSLGIEIHFFSRGGGGVPKNFEKKSCEISMVLGALLQWALPVGEISWRGSDFFPYTPPPRPKGLYLHDQVAITVSVLTCRGATRQQFRVMKSKADLAAATATGDFNVYTMMMVLEHNELVQGNGLSGRGRGSGGRGGRGGRSGGRGVQAGGWGFETRGRGHPAQLSIAAPPVVAAPAMMYQAPQQRSGGYGGGRR
jgi:hypothetical protein